MLVQSQKLITALIIGLGSLVVKVKVLTENYMKTNFREGPVVMFPLKQNVRDKS